jgi:hypothetical protein
MKRKQDVGVAVGKRPQDRAREGERRRHRHLSNSASAGWPCAGASLSSEPRRLPPRTEGRRAWSRAFDRPGHAAKSCRVQSERRRRFDGGEGERVSAGFEEWLLAGRYS